MTGWKRRLQGSLYHRKVIALSGSRRKIVRSKRDLSDREICLLLLHEVEHRQLWTPTLLLLARRSQDQGLAQLVHLLTSIQGLVWYRHRPAHRWLGADWVLQLTRVAVQGTVFSREGVLHVKSYWLYRMAAVAAFRSISSSSSNLSKIGRTILSPSPQPRSNLFLPPSSSLIFLSWMHMLSNNLIVRLFLLKRKCWAWDIVFCNSYGLGSLSLGIKYDFGGEIERDSKF